MDQPGTAPHFRPTPQTVNGKVPADPDALPPSPARRAQLLFILIVLPVVAVTLPAIVITSIFGQRPKVKPAASDVSGLNDALQRSATSLLPTPSALTGEPINLRCRPDRLAARTDRVKELAGAFGGTINEWLGSEIEKHFYVELPPGRAEAFRQSLVNDAPVAAPSPAATLASGAAATVAAKDQVEVFIRANSED